MKEKREIKRRKVRRSSMNPKKSGETLDGDVGEEAAKREDCTRKISKAKIEEKETGS